MACIGMSHVTAGGYRGQQPTLTFPPRRPRGPRAADGEGTVAAGRSASRTPTPASPLARTAHATHPPVVSREERVPPVVPPSCHMTRQLREQRWRLSRHGGGLGPLERCVKQNQVAVPGCRNPDQELRGRSDHARILRTTHRPESRSPQRSMEPGSNPRSSHHSRQERR